MLILFLKSSQLGLFEAPVQVRGSVRKDGTVIKPHTAMRKKRLQVVAGGKAPEQSELFEPQIPDAAQGASDQPRADTFQPTHELPDGTRVAAHPEEPGVWVDRDGNEIEDENAYPLANEVRQAQPKRVAAEPSPVVNQLLTTGLDYSLPFEQIPVPGFGVSAGTSRAERKRLNADALALLDAKQDGFTGEDKAVLRQYTGRGGIGDSLNEFYTDPHVAAAMWKSLHNLGFPGGSVLEPCCATGVFLATAPQNTRVTGVELDPTSSRIAQILHGDRHETVNASLERFAPSDLRQFDAVIGNVPFGLRGALIKADKPKLKTAEQYFADAALDKTRDGGLVALIVPTGIMDGQNTRTFRTNLLRKAEFLGAQRLPNSAFEAAHTEVTTDILYLRKRPQEVAGALGTLSAEQVAALGIHDEEFVSGRYFSGRGKDNIFGAREEGWRSKAGMGRDFTVTGSMAGVPDEIAAFAPHPEGATVGMAEIMDVLKDDPAAQEKARSGALKQPYAWAQPGDIKTVDGISYVLQGQPPRWHRLDEQQASAAVADAQALAPGLDSLFEQARLRVPDLALRAKLAQQVEAYVETHGIPAKNKELRAAAVFDKTLYRLIGAVNPDGSLSDLLAGARAVAGADAFDTVAQALALEQDAFTPDDIAARWGGRDLDTVLDHLFASTQYALEADGQRWTSRDNYLSGDLWARLDAARTALAHEGLTAPYRARYAQQVQWLEEAIDPRSLEDVEVQINSAWVPLDVVAAFFNERKNAGNDWMRQQQDMQIQFGNGVYRIEGGLHEAKLLDKYLNRTGVRQTDLPLIEQWNRDFQTWLAGSEYRAQVEDLYNRKFRGFRQKTHSDAAIPIPGLNPALDVNAYHYAGLRWALEEGKGIIAADVGLGKTGRALMLAKLDRSLGKAQKPTFVVPKSVLANWVAEAEFWFPGSKVLTIGETYSRDKHGELVGREDSAAERDRKYHALSQNSDYDFVFISEPAFNDLDLDPETKHRYVSDDFWVQRGDALGNAGDKRVKRIRESYEQSVASREFQKRSEAIYFNDLGIDRLYVDEAHHYKNLYAARNRFGEQPKFLGGQGLSNRALDLNLKARWVREQNDGKGVYGLTATPTKNSPLEIYSMISHVAPEAFERIGIRNSEDFLDRFAEFAMDNVLTVDGQIERALVTVGFKNLDELREIMRRYIDRKTAEDVGLVLPAKDQRMHLVDMAPEQEAVYAELRKLADKSNSDQGENAHIFAVMDKMAKAAMDLELLDPKRHAGFASPKYAAVAKAVVEGIPDGGQIVFADYVGAHEKIAKALVKAGVPRARIAIVNAKAAKSSAQRQNISDRFNRGELDVVIGNTPTMGEGMNLQKRAADIHDMDIPWDPATLQQRHGRGVRQGNRNETVRLHAYLSKGSFDGYRYQTMSAKRDWQDLLWNGGDRVENLAREGQFSRDELMILLAADPEAARKQYEENKTAAEERQAAAGRKASAEIFTRFQAMRRSLRALKDKQSASAARLETQIARLRTSLAADKHFLAKDALDTDAPVLIQPETGTAWHAGRAFEMAPGPDAPLNWSADKGSRWVVTGVDLDHGTLRVRPYGGLSADQSYTVSLDKMQRGVRPVDYDEEAELQTIADKSAQSEKAGAAVATNPGALKGVRPETIRKIYPIIQEQLRESFRAYKDRHQPDHVLMLDGDGRPVAFPSYEARKHLDTHELMLPLPEHRDKALEGWIAAENAKRIVTRYVQKRRNSDSRAEGIKARYANYKESNPWTQAAREMYGDEFEQEARSEHLRRQVEAAKQAPDFPAAMAALVSTLQLPSYGAHTVKWPKEALSALWEKAQEEGVMDASMQGLRPREAHADIFKPAEHALHGSALDKPVTDALIHLAKGSGHKGLAADFTVQRAKAQHLSPEATLRELVKLRGEGSSFYTYSKPVLEAMRHVVDAAGLQDVPAGQLIQNGYSDDFSAQDRKNRPIGEVLNALLGRE